MKNKKYKYIPLIYYFSFRKAVSVLKKCVAQKERSDVGNERQ